MCSLSLNLFLVPDKLVIRWKRNVCETERYEITEKQNLDKKTKAAFQLDWFSFYNGLDL